MGGQGKDPVRDELCSGTIIAGQEISSELGNLVQRHEVTAACAETPPPEDPEHAAAHFDPMEYNRKPQVNRLGPGKGLWNAQRFIFAKVMVEESGIPYANFIVSIER